MSSKHLINILFSALLFSSAVFADQVQVNLSSVANGSWCSVGGGSMFGCNTLPVGDLTVNGELFNISGVNGGNTAWFSSVAANNGPGTVSVTVPVNVVGATSVDTLMNTFWGQSGKSYDTVTFTGSGGATYTVSLVGGQNIRDYNNYIWTDSINGTTTVNGWSNTGGAQRLDEQMFTLPSSFANQTLESMTITDSGNYGFSRLFLAGMTVNTDPADPPTAAAPEPVSLALSAIGLIGLGLLPFRKRLSR